MNHIILSVSALLLILALACPAFADGIGVENKAFIKAFNGNKHASELGLFFGKPVSSDARGHKEVTTYRIGLRNGEGLPRNRTDQILGHTGRHVQRRNDHLWRRPASLRDADADAYPSAEERHHQGTRA